MLSVPEPTSPTVSPLARLHVPLFTNAVPTVPFRTPRVPVVLVSRPPEMVRSPPAKPPTLTDAALAATPVDKIGPLPFSTYTESAAVGTVPLDQAEEVFQEPVPEIQLTF